MSAPSSQPKSTDSKPPVNQPRPAAGIAKPRRGRNHGNRDRKSRVSTRTEHASPTAAQRLGESSCESYAAAATPPHVLYDLLSISPRAHHPRNQAGHELRGPAQEPEGGPGQPGAGAGRGGAPGAAGGGGAAGYVRGRKERVRDPRAYITNCIMHPPRSHTFTTAAKEKARADVAKRLLDAGCVLHVPTRLDSPGVHEPPIRSCEP